MFFKFIYRYVKLYFLAIVNLFKRLCCKRKMKHDDDDNHGGSFDFVVVQNDLSQSSTSGPSGLAALSASHGYQTKQQTFQQQQYEPISDKNFLKSESSLPFNHHSKHHLEPEVEPEPNYFEDMVPKLKKPKKVSNEFFLIQELNFFSFRSSSTHLIPSIHHNNSNKEILHANFVWTIVSLLSWTTTSSLLLALLMSNHRLDHKMRRTVTATIHPTNRALGKTWPPRKGSGATWTIPSRRFNDKHVKIDCPSINNKSWQKVAKKTRGVFETFSRRNLFVHFPGEILIFFSLRPFVCYFPFPLWSVTLDKLPPFIQCK